VDSGQHGLPGPAPHEAPPVSRSRIRPAAEAQIRGRRSPHEKSKLLELTMDPALMEEQDGMRGRWFGCDVPAVRNEAAGNDADRLTPASR